MITRMTQSEYRRERVQPATKRPARPPVPAPARLPAFEAVLAGVKALKASEWKDTSLHRIPDEAFARLAFQLSAPLQAEFKTVDTFLAYWRRLTRRTRKVD